MKSILIITLILSTGCASLRERDRILIGAGTGAAVGAIGGTVLSPNDESKGMNALVFGLGGALVGGLAAILSDRPDSPKVQNQSLKDKELGSVDEFKPREFIVPVDENLPEFVRKRMKPAVIEEFVESDSIAEDGSLRAPHKVYRIKHQVELFPVREEAPESPKKKKVMR